MSKFNKLFYLPEALHAENCPIIIVAGALYKLDTTDEKLLLQLKFKNIGQKTAKAIKVAFRTFDITGNVIDEKREHQYLDLNLRHTTEYTDRKGVPLSTKTIRSFTVEITEIVFEDGDIWSDSNTEFIPLPTENAIENKLADLAIQYKREIGTLAAYEPFEHKDLWFCCCGEFNHSSDKRCHRCKVDKIKQFHSLDTSFLTENKKTFEKQEKELAEKRAAAARVYKDAKRKTRIKIYKIVCISFLVFAMSIFLINNAAERKAYSNGIALMEQGNYNEAKSIFSDLGTFKDSAEKYSECIYQSGLIYFEDGDLKAALQAFEKIPNYKDSKQQTELIKKEEKYVECIEKIKENNGGDMSSVKEDLEGLDGYKNSEKYLKGFVKRVVKIEGGYISGRSIKFYYNNEGYLSSTNSNYTFAYSEDKRNVIVTRKTPSSTTTYKYDKDGKIINYGDTSYSYKYNNDGTVSSQTHISASRTSTYYYSYENGRVAEKKMTTLPVDNISTTITYRYDYNEDGDLYRVHKNYSLSSGETDQEYIYGWVYAPDATKDSEIMTTATPSKGYGITLGADY